MKEEAVRALHTHRSMKTEMKKITMMMMILTGMMMRLPDLLFQAADTVMKTALADLLPHVTHEARAVTDNRLLSMTTIQKILKMNLDVTMTKMKMKMNTAAVTMAAIHQAAMEANPADVMAARVGRMAEADPTETRANRMAAADLTAMTAMTMTIMVTEAAAATVVTAA